MSPATILLLMQAVNAAITAAPKVAAVVEDGINYIKQLCSKGLITIAQQDAIIAGVMAHKGLVDAGIISRGWTVDPDPSA